MGSESGPLPRRHCGKGQRRSRALSIDPFPTGRFAFGRGRADPAKSSQFSALALYLRLYCASCVNAYQEDRARHGSSDRLPRATEDKANDAH